jgi:hypothetical protein
MSEKTKPVDSLSAEERRAALEQLLRKRIGQEASRSPHSSSRDELIAGYIGRLRSMGVNFWIEEERLQCSAPPGILTRELQAEIAHRRAELTDHVKAGTVFDSSQSVRLQGSGVHDVRRVSFSQQRLWFLDQLEPGNPAYIITGLLWIDGALNVPALGRALICDV